MAQVLEALICLLFQRPPGLRSSTELAQGQEAQEWGWPLLVLRPAGWGQLPN